MPRVSVLTPLYNTNPVHLREMIESILNQTFTDFEFLILNDSPNNTEIEEIVARHNYHRQNVSPYAKNMQKMTWDHFLADKAQKYIQSTCAMNHNSNISHPVCARF